MTRLPLTLTILAFIPLISGCHARQTAITRGSLVGSYVYVSEDPEDIPSKHNLSQLVLRPDGTFELVEGGTTKPPTKTSGTWTLEEGVQSGQDVVLGHAGYPVRVTSNQIRLLVDDDVGIWWAKTNTR